MRYVLNRKNWRAVVDTKGAELISCQENQLEYVWSGDPVFWSSHNPVLFPIIGCLCNGRTTFGGVPYAMARHGFAKHSEFEVRRVSEDEITLVLIESAVTAAQYPFSFELSVTHTLTDEGFITRYKIYNTGKDVLPFSIGGHTGINCPLRPGEKFEDYQLVFDQPEASEAWLADEAGLMSPDNKMTVFTDSKQVLPLSYDLFAQSALIFPHLQSRKISLAHKEKATGIDFRFYNFANLGIWTPPEQSAPFICLEPWQGLPSFADDAWIFEEKPDTIFLSSGTAYEAGYEMKVR